MRRALDEVEASDSRTEEASEGHSFVDIMSKLENETGVNLKGSHMRTFCNVLIYCQKLYWRKWSILLICHCVSPHPSYSCSFNLRIKMVVIHILPKIVHSARLFMKLASWGFVFLCLILPEILLIALSRWCVGFRAVPEPSSGTCGCALRPRRRLLAFRQVLPWKFRQVCSMSVFCFGKLGTI